MAANNNNIAPWYPPAEPGESAGTRDWKVLITTYLWGLRGHTNNLTTIVQNHNNNIAQALTVIQQITNSNGNSATSKPPVIYGTHSLRLSYVPGLYTGYVFVETDRFQAAYYSNSNTWVLLEATATGSFESRYSNLNGQDLGFVWLETSRNNVNSTVPLPLYRWNGNNWQFISGTFYRNQNQLTTLAGTMNAANSFDVGAPVNVVDFAGQLQWAANNNWTWGPEDSRMHGMGPILAEVDPSPTTGWQLYDGSNTSYLQANGNVASLTLPNLVSGNNVAFLEAGNVNSGVNPPVVPVFTGNAAAGNVAGTFAGNSANFNTANILFSVGANTVLTGPNPVGVSGNITANFTGNNVTGNISNNGQPPSIVRRAWFRR